MDIKKIGSGVFLLVSLFLLGFLAGGLLGGRVFGGGGMGWDQIADALGGAFIGILTGIVLAIVLIQRLPVRHQVLVAIAAVVLSVGVVILLRVLPKPQVTHLENDIRSDVAFVPQAAVTCFRSPSCEMNMRRVWSDQ